MTVFRSVLYYSILAIPFGALLAFGQVVHGGDAVSESIDLIHKHDRYFLIGIAALGGGFLEIMLGSSVSWMESPKGPAGVFKRMAFDFIAGIMFLPWVIEAWLPSASNNAIVAFSCMFTTVMPQLLPIARGLFLRQAQDRMERTETRVTQLEQGGEKSTRTEIKTDVVVTPKKTEPVE